MRAVSEISVGILLVIGLLNRPVAFVAFLFLGSLWISEWGTSWIWELARGAPFPRGGDQRI